MEVSVSLEFLVDGAVDHRVDVVPEEAQLSRANEVNDEARTSNTSFHYSGRHDGGALPKLKEGGPHDRMLYAIQEAKKASDEYTTKLIAATYGSTEQGMDLAEEPVDDEEEVEEEMRAAEAKHDRKQQKGTPDAAKEKAKKARTDAV